MKSLRLPFFMGLHGKNIRVIGKTMLFKFKIHFNNTSYKVNKWRRKDIEKYWACILGEMLKGKDSKFDCNLRVAYMIFQGHVKLNLILYVPKITRLS
jgi:hypothetical protein